MAHRIDEELSEEAARSGASQPQPQSQASWRHQGSPQQQNYSASRPPWRACSGYPGSPPSFLLLSFPFVFFVFFFFKFLISYLRQEKRIRVCLLRYTWIWIWICICIFRTCRTWETATTPCFPPQQQPPAVLMVFCIHLFLFLSFLIISTQLSHCSCCCHYYCCSATYITYIRNILNCQSNLLCCAHRIRRVVARHGHLPSRENCLEWSWRRNWYSLVCFLNFHFPPS